jgi:hypothetical protein
MLLRVSSSLYNAQAFLDEIYDKGYLEILSLTTQEVQLVEASSIQVRGAVAAREQGSGQYVAVLKAFLFFMRSGIKPGGISDEDFARFRPICARLVEKGTFQPSVLEPFDRER